MIRYRLPARLEIPKDDTSIKVRLTPVFDGVDEGVLFDTTIGSTLGYPLIINTDASGNITDVRTAFNNHAYAVLNGSVYDACAGPVIELTLTNYFGIAIDFDANKQWNALLIALGRDVNIEGFYETTTEIINAVQYFTINVLR